MSYFLRILIAGGLVATLGLINLACQTNTAEKTNAVLDAQRESLAPEARILFFEAQKAYQQQRYRAALALVDSVMNYDRNLADAYFLQGRVLVKLKQYDAAQTAFEKVAAEVPTYPDLWYALANQAFRRGQYQEAIQLYRKETTTAGSQSTVTNSQASSHIFLQIGRAYLYLGKTDSAKYAYTQALTYDSTFSKAHSDLSQLYEDAGELDKALSSAQKAWHYDSTNMLYRYVLGKMLVQQNRYEEARPHLKAAVLALPWHHGAHYNFGRLLVRTGDEKKAKQYLARANKLQGLESQISQARISAVRSNNAERWVKWANLLEESGRYRKALGIYKTARDLAPNNDSIRIHIQRVQTQVSR